MVQDGAPVPSFVQFYMASIAFMLVGVPYGYARFRGLTQPTQVNMGAIEDVVDDVAQHRFGAFANVMVVNHPRVFFQSNLVRLLINSSPSWSVLQQRLGEWGNVLYRQVFAHAIENEPMFNPNQEPQQAPLNELQAAQHLADVVRAEPNPDPVVLRAVTEYLAVLTRQSANPPDPEYTVEDPGGIKRSESSVSTSSTAQSQASTQITQGRHPQHNIRLRISTVRTLVGGLRGDRELVRNGRLTDHGLIEALTIISHDIMRLSGVEGAPEVINTITQNTPPASITLLNRVIRTLQTYQQLNMVALSALDEEIIGRPSEQFGSLIVDTIAALIDIRVRTPP